MIIVRIVNGLGNQMFQYAIGRTLSLVHGVPLKLDVGEYRRNPQHNGFELTEVFSLPVAIAEPKDLRSMLGWRGAEIPRRALKKESLSRFRGTDYIVEPSLRYWPGVEELRPPFYLVGYWQSQRYFEQASEALRREFSFVRDPGRKNTQWLEAIAGCEAISLHIRRGDYLASPQAFARHGVCPVGYYHRAIEHMKSVVGNPEIFVFSDDIEWARDTLDLGCPTHFVSENSGRNSYNDMRLMASCRHHIIANSSFSWWGAWLGANPQKVVIAPERWFADGTPQEIVPDSWVKL